MQESEGKETVGRKRRGEGGRRERGSNLLPMPGIPTCRYLRELGLGVKFKKKEGMRFNLRRESRRG